MLPPAGAQAVREQQLGGMARRQRKSRNGYKALAGTWGSLLKGFEDR